MNQPQVLILPGLYNSGPGHWQTIWQEENPDFMRVQQDDWETPLCADWVDALHTAVQKCSQPPLLVAHSLGCILVAHWWNRSQQAIQGALLVAPADVESPEHCPPEIWNFAPIPLPKFNFPAIVIASRNDPYVAFDRARFFAEQWGCQFVDYGRSGHINADSGLGRWPDGLNYLDILRQNKGQGKNQ